MSIKLNQQFLIIGLTIIAGSAVIVSATTFLPNRAFAFWPFSTNNTNTTDSTIIPSASTPALIAPVNENPNIETPLTLATSDGSALVSYTGISGTIADISNVTPPDRISLYVVRPGDTLSTIAKMFDVSVNTIVWANNLPSTRDIQPGNTLLILPISGIQHTVTKGETLKSIAEKYSANANEIAQFNGLDSSVALTVGSTVIIPGGEFSPSGIGTSIRKNGKYRVGPEPYLGGSGPAQSGYYSNPMPGGIITQGIHGWNAVDIGAPLGTPIHAAANGIVIVSRDNGSWNGGYGNYVVITHDNGTQTLYAHMKRSAVSVGQSVSSGQIIGYVGMTGLTTGPHVHFEVRGAANPFRNCTVGTICEPQ